MYCGAGLILTTIPKVSFYTEVCAVLSIYLVKGWQLGQTQQLIFTCKQINTVERLMHIAVIFSQRNQMNFTRDAVAKCFDHVKELFFYDSEAPCADT